MQLSTNDLESKKGDDSICCDFNEKGEETRGRTEVRGWKIEPLEGESSCQLL